MVARSVWLPNLRRFIIPDEGMILASADLAGADAQVVAWDSGARLLKEGFRSGMKIHAFNAINMYGKAQAGHDGKNEPYYSRCKVLCHAFNYFGQPRGVAGKAGLVVRECEDFQRRWFQMNPEIPRWHKRINTQLLHNQTIKNALGYVITFRARYKPTKVDGMSPLLPKALAWIAQGSVAFVTQLAQINLIFRPADELPWLDMLLLQVHDELVMQWPIEYNHLRHQILPYINITLPYADPLIIPWALKTSTDSWGECVDCKWQDAA